MNEVEVKWTEILSREKGKLEALAQEMGIHPLAVEDCLHSNQRAKFEDFETHQLLVWFTFVAGRIYELEFIIFPQAVILVTSEPPPGCDSWRSFLRVDRTHRDANHALYQALDRAADAFSASTRPLVEGIASFEEEVFNSTTDPRTLLALKSQLSLAEFSISYLSAVIGHWQRFLNPKDDLRWRLRDLGDHCERTHQRLIFARTQISSAMEMYWGVNAKRTNDRIKKLTMLASAAVPLSFWTSFWGMNFESMPFKNPNTIWVALAIMAGSAAAMYLILRRKGYWED